MSGRALLVLLVVANVLSAIGVVYARHEHRQLFIRLTRLEKARDELNIEFGRLPSGGRMRHRGRAPGRPARG